MPRDIRYTCKQHGTFLVTLPAGPPRPAPRTARCPTCRRVVKRTHRSPAGGGGRSISIRMETFELLKREAERRHIPVRWVVEDLTKDIK